MYEPVTESAYQKKDRIREHIQDSARVSLRPKNPHLKENPIGVIGEFTSSGEEFGQM
jgi:hypothetical protein